MSIAGFSSTSGLSWWSDARAMPMPVPARTATVATAAARRAPGVCKRNRMKPSYRGGIEPGRAAEVRRPQAVHSAFGAKCGGYAGRAKSDLGTAMVGWVPSQHAPEVTCRARRCILQGAGAHGAPLARIEPSRTRDRYEPTEIEYPRGGRAHLRADGRDRSEHDSLAVERQGDLAAQRRFLRGRRVFPFRQPAVERDRLSGGDSVSPRPRQAGRRLPRRRARAEFHVHRVAAAQDGDHLRHPARQHDRAPDVQGAARDVGGPRRFSVEAVQPAAPVRARHELVAAAVVRGVRRGNAGHDALQEEPGGDQVAPRLSRLRDGRQRRQVDGVHLFAVLRGRAADQLQLLEWRRRWGGFGRGNMPTYATLQVATDTAGKNWAYLATEANYRWLKDFETKNLLVPVVGNFAGPKAIRAVAQYLKEHHAVVGAFYTSNVEQYLFQQDDEWSRFYKNVATLPLDSTSTFIRSIGGGFRGGYNNARRRRCATAAASRRSPPEFRICSRRSTTARSSGTATSSRCPSEARSLSQTGLQISGDSS